MSTIADTRLDEPGHVKQLISDLDDLTNTGVLKASNGGAFNLSENGGLEALMDAVDALTDIAVEGPFNLLDYTGLTDYKTAKADANFIDSLVFFDPINNLCKGFTVKGTGTGFKAFLIWWSPINNQLLALGLTNDGGASVFIGYEIIEEPRGGRRMIYDHS